MDWQSYFIGWLVGFVSIWVLWIWYVGRSGKAIRAKEMQFQAQLLAYHDHHDTRMRQQNELIERIVLVMEPHGKIDYPWYFDALVKHQESERIASRAFRESLNRIALCMESWERRKVPPESEV